MFYRLTDDCGWTHCVEADAGVNPMLAPHTRSAVQITKEEYDDYCCRTSDSGTGRIHPRPAGVDQDDDRRE